MTPERRAEWRWRAEDGWSLSCRDVLDLLDAFERIEAEVTALREQLDFLSHKRQQVEADNDALRVWADKVRALRPATGETP